jgi:hypothetical protein
MAAPKENQFWKLRSKHGRDKLFTTPDLLWEAACEYFQWCQDNPWMKIEQARAAGKPGLAIKVKKGQAVGIQATRPTELAELPTARPYSLSGLCLYLGCSHHYFYEFKKTANEDYLDILTRIELIIETQQFEGATVGAYNANIIARKLGLTDKQEIENNVKGELTIIRKVING